MKKSVYVESLQKAKEMASDYCKAGTPQVVFECYKRLFQLKILSPNMVTWLDFDEIVLILDYARESESTLFYSIYDKDFKEYPAIFLTTDYALKRAKRGFYLLKFFFERDKAAEPLRKTIPKLDFFELDGQQLCIAGSYGLFISLLIRYTNSILASLV